VRSIALGIAALCAALGALLALPAAVAYVWASRGNDPKGIVAFALVVGAVLLVAGLALFGLLEAVHRSNRQLALGVEVLAILLAGAAVVWLKLL
jgi:hypothetical protein